MHKDATDRPIIKGSYVIYAVTQGSRSGLKFGVVVKLKETVWMKNVFDQVTQAYREEPYTAYKIQVISAENAYDYPTQTRSWKVQGKSPGKLARVQTLDRLDRVVVLDPSQMHPEAKEVLDRELHERGQL